jgi:predicted  nucleic acid-binding Zn-ribbon protein
VTDTTQGPGDESPLNYNTLLRRYGEAMVRISELQEEVNRLERLADDLVPEPADTTAMESQDRTGGEDLEGRLGRLERRVTGDAPAAVSGTPEDDSLSPGEPNDAVQLRLQLTSLAGQLSQTQRELEEARQQRGRNRRRSRSKSESGQHRWWRFW